MVSYERNLVHKLTVGCAVAKCSTPKMKRQGVTLGRSRTALCSRATAATTAVTPTGLCCQPSASSGNCTTRRLTHALMTIPSTSTLRTPTLGVFSLAFAWTLQLRRLACASSSLPVPTHISSQEPHVLSVAPGLHGVHYCLMSRWHAPHAIPALTVVRQREFIRVDHQVHASRVVQQSVCLLDDSPGLATNMVTSSTTACGLSYSVPIVVCRGTPVVCRPHHTARSMVHLMKWMGSMPPPCIIPCPMAYPLCREKWGGYGEDRGGCREDRGGCGEDAERIGEDARTIGEDAGRTGVDVVRTGEDMGRIGEDARRIGEDAGRIGEDAGRIGEDAGRIGEDAGRTREDAGRIGEDAGRTGEDARRIGEDAGTSGEDEGSIGEDAGRIREDARRIGEDAGRTREDAGRTAEDAGRIGEDARRTR